MKTPAALARYLKSHRTVNWKALWNALGLKESPLWLPPCGSNLPVAEGRCTAEILQATAPDQRIVVVRGDILSWTVEFFRYVKDAAGDWRFSGEYNAFQRDSPSHYRLMSLLNKPFIAITSDHSQNGVATQQVFESWFDLTQPDFEPVFGFTVDGGQSRFGFGVGRTIHATYKVERGEQVDRIELTLNIHYDGPSFDQKSTYVGVFERRANEKTFKLRSAYTGPDRGARFDTADFADLADPFSGLANEKLVAWALPGLEKIATGSDPNAREWLESVLDQTRDTPEKRTLLNLLGKP